MMRNWQCHHTHIYNEKLSTRTSWYLDERHNLIMSCTVYPFSWHPEKTVICTTIDTAIASIQGLECSLLGWWGIFLISLRGQAVVSTAGRNYAGEKMQLPTCVGVTVLISSSVKHLRTVVLPALSRPRTKIRASWKSQEHDMSFQPKKDKHQPYKNIKHLKQVTMCKIIVPISSHNAQDHVLGWRIDVRQPSMRVKKSRNKSMHFENFPTDLQHICFTKNQSDTMYINMHTYTSNQMYGNKYLSLWFVKLPQHSQ